MYVHRKKLGTEDQVTITGLFADMWSEYERRSNFRCESNKL